MMRINSAIIISTVMMLHMVYILTWHALFLWSLSVILLDITEFCAYLQHLVVAKYVVKFGQLLDRPSKIDWCMVDILC